jgi:hypothetical protein
LRRQLWRLQDLRDDGLGFTVELFFLALRQLLSNSVSRESHFALFVGTFPPSRLTGPSTNARLARKNFCWSWLRLSTASFPDSITLLTSLTSSWLY